MHQGSLLCARSSKLRKGLAGAPRSLHRFILPTAGGSRSAHSPSTAACTGSCCNSSVLPATWCGEGSSVGSGNAADALSLNPKLEWFEQPAEAWPPASSEVHAATQTEATGVQTVPPAAVEAEAGALTPECCAAACTAVAAVPTRSGKPQLARFGFSEKKCCVTNWSGPTVVLYQKHKDRTVRVPDFCPCGCGMPPYSEAEWESGYLDTAGAPKKDDPNDPRNQPGRRLDKAGLEQHKPMSGRLMAFYHCSASSTTRAGSKYNVISDRHTLQKVLAGKRKRVQQA